ncbi:hypothetical protein EDD85DRAFT_16079 [Armillaria nabsnona]|nr:hypothetical protein EDD85DRAFT_16079 [Armillaria nabsnona]
MDRHIKACYDPESPLPFHQFHSQPASVFEETKNEDVVPELIHFRLSTASNQLHTQESLENVLRVCRLDSAKKVTLALPACGLLPLGLQWGTACIYIYQYAILHGVPHLHYRHRLFENGPYDHNTLAYLIVALRPVVRKKIPEVVLLAKLERKRHPGYVEQ